MPVADIAVLQNERLPGGLRQQLHQRTGHHRAAPDHRRVVIHQKRHGHNLTIREIKMQGTTFKEQIIAADNSHISYRIIGSITASLRFDTVDPLR